MRTKLFGYLGGLAIAIVAWLAALPVELSSQQSVTVQIDNDDIGGVVTSAQGAGSGCVGDRGNHRSADAIRARWW